MTLEHTSNWQDSVLITAARIADSRMPAIHGLNSRLASSMNTRSEFSSTGPACSGWVPKKAIPKNPTPRAPARQRIIQVMPTRRATGMVRMLSAAMKRARMCGWPK